MSIEVPLNEYDLTGQLLPAGKSRFWKEVDRGMKKFDAGGITLNPRQPQAIPSKQNSLMPSVKPSPKAVKSKSPVKQRRKLPSPPKSRRRLDFTNKIKDEVARHKDRKRRHHNEERRCSEDRHSSHHSRDYGYAADRWCDRYSPPHKKKRY